jgi:hypothetical protein
MGLGPPQGDEKQLLLSNYSPGRATLPSMSSRPEKSRACGTTQGDEKQLPSSNHSLGEPPLPPCHPDRSEA